MVDVLNTLPAGLGLFASLPWDFKRADQHVSEMILITWHDTARELTEVADLDGAVGHDAGV